MVESRRFIIAIALSVLVFLLFARFSNQGTPATAGKADSTAVARKGAAAAAAKAGSTTVAATTPAVAQPGAQPGAQPAAQPAAQPVAQAPVAQAPAVPAVPAETTTVAVRQDSGATFHMTNVGATP